MDALMDGLLDWVGVGGHVSIYYGCPFTPRTTLFDEAQQLTLVKVVGLGDIYAVGIKAFVNMIESHLLKAERLDNGIIPDNLRKQSALTRPWEIVSQ
jgi:hypothetical protein